MVQQNLICQTCRDDKSFKKSGVSSKDLQGLSWLFCEDCIQEDLKSLACAWDLPLDLGYSLSRITFYIFNIVKWFSLGWEKASEARVLE